MTAAPTRAITRPSADREVLVEVDDLTVHFALRSNALDRLLGRGSDSVKAVDGVSFRLRKGEVLGLVGESGSGKTTLGRTILQLVRPTSGSVKYQGEEITGLSESRLRGLRRRMQMVFQDPNASLNPAMDMLTAIGHPLRIHRVLRGDDAIRDRVADVMERVGLTPIDQFLHKYPSDLSGGQKQRAVIARAIILGPELLVADEPVSMLDMSVRAKILELMLRLKNDLDLTYIYVTHDLATAKFFCDRIAIMYLGRIVEIGPAKEIYADPKHPYTRALLAAIPEPDPTKSAPRDLPRGEIPDAVRPPLGCSFHPRCPAAFERCGWESRDLRTFLETRWIAQGEEAYDLERPVLGDLEILDTPAHEVRLPAGSGYQGSDVAHLLDQLRGEAPDDPFWKGVAGLETHSDAVTVRFHDGVDPLLTRSGGTEAACLLYEGADRRGTD